MAWWKQLLEVDEQYRLTGWLFLKLLALIYLAAFLSLSVQITGLVGPQGILPLQGLLDYLQGEDGHRAWFETPTLFWFGAGNTALYGATVAGSLLAVLLLFGIAQRLALVLLYLLYLSLTTAGQIFLNFQWDYLLLETGFLAIFIVNGPPRLVVLMFHWLLFRLRFLSGASKLLSGDPSWSGLTTLNVYFETQPLPHVGAWYAHQLPHWLLEAMTAVVLFAELVVPFFIFLPRRFRIAAALITLLIQLGIMATSNHNFVNLLTILLCLFLLDDRLVGRLLPARLHRRLAGSQGAPAGGLQRSLTVAAVSFILVTSVAGGYRMLLQQPLPRPLAQLVYLGNNYGLGNIYHIFPTMQTERHELVIEGSHDGQRWQRYLFHYKPGPLDRAPAVVIPHQPRLDWMIWFVPARGQMMNVWFGRFMQQLQRNEPQVTGLLAHNPFREAPPRYLRVGVYRYRFTTPEERRRSGHWWRAEYLGPFGQVPPRRP